MNVDNASLYSVDRSKDYPVKIVAATFVPATEIEIALSGKSEAALKGAGRGVLECSPALAAGPYAPFIFVPCSVLTGLIGGAISAWEAAPQAKSEQFQHSSRNRHGTATQIMLADKAGAYLATISAQQVEHAGPEVKGPRSITERPVYLPQSQDTQGTLLELSILRVRYEGTGKNDSPVCLRMAARGRKLDAVTGAIIAELDYARIIECRTVSDWLTEEGMRFKAALESGYQILAEHLVDKLYLTYYPPQRPRGADTPTRPVPEYVLAPVTPRAPDMYLDFRSMTKQAKHVLGWGGMHFVDVDSLTPTLSWETFPRPFDMSVGDFANITYDVRIYMSNVLNNSLAVEPSTLLQHVTDLVGPNYSLVTPLQPCSRYFWTVRARFTLNGTRRVTEWAGAYYTAGGEVSPSHRFYYPFRTPGLGDNAGCWN